MPVATPTLLGSGFVQTASAKKSAQIPPDWYSRAPCWQRQNIMALARFHNKIRPRAISGRAGGEL